MGHPVASLFNGHFNTLANALSARERMQSVHSANIANADTPNYHANTRSFSDFLNERQTSGSASAPLATTEHGHINPEGSSPWQVQLGASNKHSAQRMDGNDVDMQREMAGMAQNQLMHELTLRLIKKRLDGMANVIREAGR